MNDVHLFTILATISILHLGQIRTQVRIAEIEHVQSLRCLLPEHCYAETRYVLKTDVWCPQRDNEMSVSGTDTLADCGTDRTDTTLCTGITY